MEELSIEEKAKRYDEAIEKAKSLLSGNQLGNAWIYKLLPELKESDGERIRKEIISALKNANVKGVYDKHLAWLEKQGEKKAAEEIEPTPIFRIGDVIKRKGKDYTFRVDRIQGGYYHCDRNHGAYFPIEQQDDWELVEHNPEWTPMDEQRVENLLAIIEGHGYPGEVAWLNSLKDRVQPKQEWSRDDSVRMDELCTFIQDYGDNFYCSSLKMIVINWLKSFKDRLQLK